jgi:hypothetical protein
LQNVTRGIEGTPRAWPAGTEVARFFTAYDHNAIIDDFIAHKAEKATQEKLGHVKTDNQTIVANEGVLSVRNAYFEPTQSTTTSGTTYFDISIGQDTGGIWELFLVGNPQPTGSPHYRAVNIGYISLNTIYEGNTVVRKLHYNEVVRHHGGAETSRLLTVNVVFFNGSSESSSAPINSNTNLRIKVSGYQSGYEGAKQKLRLRRMI